MVSLKTSDPDLKRHAIGDGRQAGMRVLSALPEERPGPSPGTGDIRSIADYGEGWPLDMLAGGL